VNDLESALKPFADAVFDDNGGIEVELSRPTYDDFCAAYFALRRALKKETK
jgi:hypothetical protein